MPGFLSDLAQAVRILLRSRTLTVTAVLTLALGLGANAAMFSATWALLLRPLPYPEPERLVSLFGTRPDRGPQQVSLLDFLDWREASRSSFANMAAYRPRSFGIATNGGDTAPEVIQVGMTTAGLFETLGVRPARGRAFTEREEVEEAPVIVLSHRLWRRLGADPGAVGGKVRLNEEPRTVVGVLPEGFDFPMQGELPEAYIPLSRADYGASRGARGLEAVARLAGGVSPEAARSALASAAARLAEAHPDSNARLGADLQSLDEALRGGNRRPLLLLTGAGLLLFLIACTNVVNLLLAHFLARSRATAIRAALGARTAQIARHFTAQGVVLTLAGAAAGLVTARLCLAALPLALPLLGGAAPPAAALDAAPLRLDGAVLLFTLGLALLVAALLALSSAALARRADLQAVLQSDDPRSGSRSRLRGALVVGQIAASTMLLLLAGLLLRSFLALLSADPGFETAGVVKFGLGLPEARYGAEEKMIAFHRDLLAKLAEIPGVEAAGAIAGLPLGGQEFRTGFQPAGAGIPRADRPGAVLAVASEGYFRTLAIPRVKGRGFRPADTPESPPVLLVNQAFERTHFPAEGALGQRIEIGWASEAFPAGTAWEIVGVVGDTRQGSLEEEVQPGIYLPMSQFPVDGCSYTVRAARTDAGLAQAVREAVRAQDGQLESVEVLPLREVVRESLGDRRLLFLLTALFSGVALLLTAVGIYGVTAWTALQRDREMALRLTLGAQARQVARLVLGQGLGLAVRGLLLGVSGFFLLQDLVASQLYGVRAMDPLTLGAVALVLCATTLLACAVPSLRVSRTEPMRAIRG